MATSFWSMPFKPGSTRSAPAALPYTARDLETRGRVLAQSQRVEHLVDEDVRGVREFLASEAEAAVRAHEDCTSTHLRERVDTVFLARRLISTAAKLEPLEELTASRPSPRAGPASDRPDASLKSDRTSRTPDLELADHRRRSRGRLQDSHPRGRRASQGGSPPSTPSAVPSCPEGGRGPPSIFGNFWRTSGFRAARIISRIPCEPLSGATFDDDPPAPPERRPVPVPPRAFDLLRALLANRPRASPSRIS